jgi:hypothetical protein
VVLMQPQQQGCCLSLETLFFYDTCCRDFVV